MSKQIKLILLRSNKLALFVILTAILILVGKVAYSEYYKLCGRCYKPVVPNTISQITKDYVNLKIVYFTGNGSLPPPYYRSYTLTILTNASGAITGEYKISDGRNELEKRALIISREQLSELMAASAKIDPKTNDSVNLGCTGGSAKSINVAQDNKALLETSTYNCGGKSSNESLEKFSVEIEKLL